MNPEQFLHRKDSSLQRHETVQDAVEKRNRLNLAKRKELIAGHEGDESAEFGAELEALKKIANTPEARIDAYLQRLEAIFLNQQTINEGDETETTKARRNLELLKPYIYKAFTIAEDAIPESYWNLQRKVSKERGESFPEEISQTMRERAFENISRDQKHSLDYWMDYLAGPNAFYPTWFKFLTIKSILGLSEYDKVKREFPKRTKSTTGNFPDLNSEALTETLTFFKNQLAGTETENPIPEPDNIHAPNEKKAVSDEEFQGILSTENFAKYYSFNIEHSVSYRELWPITEGEWVVYTKGEAGKLTEAIQGKGTGWCTAGISTSEEQLTQGDFHVYFSNNALGESTIPRLAIRMKNGQIAELRGVDNNQNLDPYITPILEAKLPEFGDEGGKYEKRVSDMKRLTLIDNQVKAGGILTGEDLKFLYQIEDKITSFRQGGPDPRIKEILEGRNWKEDIGITYGGQSDAEIAFAMLDSKQSALLLENLDKFSNLSEELAYELIKRKATSTLLRHLDSFSELDERELAEFIASDRQSEALYYSMDKLTSLSSTEIAQIILTNDINGSILIADHLDNFPDVSQNELAELLLNREAGRKSLARNAKRFTDLDKATIANKLLEKGELVAVLQDYDKFDNFDDQFIAELSIGQFKTKELAWNLAKFKTITGTAVPDKLIEVDEASAVARNIDMFPDIDKQDIADRLVQLDKSHLLLKNLDKFSGVEIDFSEMVKNILAGDSNRRLHLLDNIKKFDEQLQLSIAHELIRLDDGYQVSVHIKDFSNSLHKQISRDLVEYANTLSGEPRTYFITRCFDEFSNFVEFDSSVAEALYSVDHRHIITTQLEKFSDLNHQETADGLGVPLLAENIHKFKNLNQETFEKLLTTPAKSAGERGVNFYYLLNNLENFIISDYQKIADKLIELGQQKELANHLDKFEQLSAGTAKRLVPVDSYAVAKHLDKFVGVNQQEIADELIALNKISSIAANLVNFTEISQQALETIITEQTNSEVVRGLQYLDIERFDQDTLAAKLIGTNYNVFFCGLDQLPKYKVLTKYQLWDLDRLPQEERADAAKKMAEEEAGV